MFFAQPSVLPTDMLQGRCWHALLGVQVRRCEHRARLSMTADKFENDFAMSLQLTMGTYRYCRWVQSHLPCMPGCLLEKMTSKDGKCEPPWKALYAGLGLLLHVIV